MKNKKMIDPFAGINSLPEFFVWYRTRMGYSQGDLSKLLKCTQSYISQIEAGQHDLPIQICRELAKHLSEPEKQKLTEILRMNIKL